MELRTAKLLYSLPSSSISSKNFRSGRQERKNNKRRVRLLFNTKPNQMAGINYISTSES